MFFAELDYNEKLTGKEQSVLGTWGDRLHGLAWFSPSPFPLAPSPP